MTCYVDPLARNGWRLGPNCHLFTDGDLQELHALAGRIGMKRAWFQPFPQHSVPHYDLTASRRAAAVKCGAVEVDRRRAVQIWRAWRAQQ